MSFGGDFFAMTDEQLEGLVDGSLELAFLYGDLEQKPREVYSDAEYAWYELTQILGSMMMSYSESTDAIPEISQLTWASDVAALASELADLDAATIEALYNDSEEMGCSLEELKGYIQGLTAFYQRAANNGDAVLFRVT